MVSVGDLSSMGTLQLLSLDLLARMVGELGSPDRGRAREACRALASLCRTTSLALKGTTSADEFDKLVGWWNVRGPHHAIPASLEWLSLDNCWRLEKLPEGSDFPPTLPPTELPSPRRSTPSLHFHHRHPRHCVVLNRSLSEGFGELPALADLDMDHCHVLAEKEGTYAILSKISTLTKLSLNGCNMRSLPEGSP